MKFFALCLLVLSLAAAVFSAPTAGADMTTGTDTTIDENNPEGRFFIDYFLSSSSSSSESCSSSSEEKHKHIHYWPKPAVTTPCPVVPT